MVYFMLKWGSCEENIIETQLSSTLIRAMTYIETQQQISAKNNTNLKLPLVSESNQN